MASEKKGEIISGSSSSCIIQVDDEEMMNEEDILDVDYAWIFRVSKPLRDSDRFYSPKLVSIGPFHYGKKELKGMEKSKSEAVRRMQKRIQRYDPRASIKSFVEEHVLIKDKEIRKFYGEHIPFLPIKLAWMVARDACFLFEFLVNYVQWSNEAKSLLKEEVTVFSWKYDAVFDVGYQNPMRETLMDDILLLENQILLWVLKDLLEIRMGSPQAANQKLDELMELLLRRAVGQGIFMWNDYDSHNISCHVLEVVYHGMVGNNVDSYNDGEALEMPPSPSSMQICFEKTVDSMKTIFGRSCKLCMRFSSSNRSHGETQQTLSSPHNRMQIWFKKGVDSMRAICGKMCLGLHSSNTRGEAVNLFFLKPPTALELTRAGVKIHPVTFENRPREVGSGIQWIRFYEKTSTLYLPQMKVTLQSDSVLRNMIAMEVSIEERYRPRPMTQFVMFMDELIDSEEDVAVLRKAEVIKNFLGSNQQVADLFNSLAKGITTAEGCKVIDEARIGLDRYMRRKYKILWSEFIRAYFSKPWLVAGSMGAVLLLLMTVVQVGCLFFTCNS